MNLRRRSRERGNPAFLCVTPRTGSGIPAFAGMTDWLE
jgi:hypothetical protein